MSHSAQSGSSLIPSQIGVKAVVRRRPVSQPKRAAPEDAGLDRTKPEQVVDDSEGSDAPRKTVPFAVDDSSLQLRSPVEGPALAALSSAENLEFTPREFQLSASLLVGGSFIDRGERSMNEDVTLRLDAAFGSGHQVGLIVGRAAGATERRAENTYVVPARPVSAAGKESKEKASLQARSDPAPYEMQVSREVWFGVSYGYSVALGTGLDAGIGAKAGAGARAWRLGLELPLRYRVSQSVALELVPSVSRVVPHDLSKSEFTIESPADGYLYEAESGRATFSTYGAEVGIRVNLW